MLPELKKTIIKASGGYATGLWLVWLDWPIWRTIESIEMVDMVQTRVNDF